MIAVEKIYTPDQLVALATTVTPKPQQRHDHIQQLIDQNNVLRAENATLRTTLIDATGQRDQAQRRAAVLQAELDKLLQGQAV